LEEPSFLAIEILSRRDAMSDVLEKLEEDAAAGVLLLWLFDPWRKKAFTFAGNRLEEVMGGMISTDATIQLRLDEVFQGL
jgi:Uma2 family endonuclease